MRAWSVLLFAVSLSACDLDSTSSEVAAPKPGSGLTVTLDKRDGTIVFQNAGPSPVYILKPIDGSVDGRLMPSYRFTVRDPDGQPVKLKPIKCGCCGVWANTKWPQDYLVEIKPGTSYRVDTGWGWHFDIRRDGPHTVSFEYIYQPTNERYAPPPTAWRGKIAAPDIILSFKKN